MTQGHEFARHFHLDGQALEVARDTPSPYHPRIHLDYRLSIRSESNRRTHDIRQGQETVGVTLLGGECGFKRFPETRKGLGIAGRGERGDDSDD